MRMLTAGRAIGRHRADTRPASTEPAAPLGMR